MARNYHAGQFEDRYKPTMLGNWCAENSVWPGKRCIKTDNGMKMCCQVPTGLTRFIGGENGHLLPEIRRNVNRSPWGRHVEHALDDIPFGCHGYGSSRRESERQRAKQNIPPECKKTKIYRRPLKHQTFTEDTDPRTFYSYGNRDDFDPRKLRPKPKVNTILAPHHDNKYGYDNDSLSHWSSLEPEPVKPKKTVEGAKKLHPELEKAKHRRQSGYSTTSLRGKNKIWGKKPSNPPTAAAEIPSSTSLSKRTVTFATEEKKEPEREEENEDEESDEEEEEHEDLIDYNTSSGLVTEVDKSITSVHGKVEKS